MDWVDGMDEVDGMDRESRVIAVIAGIGMAMQRKTLHRWFDCAVPRTSVRLRSP